MADPDPTLRPPCACGCGQRVNKYRSRFIYGHDHALKMASRPPQPFCVCGCGEPVEPRQGKPWKWNRYVHNHHQRGPEHHRWQGGWMRDAMGYIYIRRPGHPRANPSGYVKRATLIAEAMLGRFLIDDEQVHHVNEQKDDDSPDNLQVLKCGEHTRIHASGEANSFHRLTESDVREIRSLRAQGMKLTEIGERFGIHYSTVSGICRRAAWKHVA